MKKALALALAFLLTLAGLTGLAEEARVITLDTLLEDLLAAYEQPSDEALTRIDADTAALDSELADAIAAHWKRIYLDPGFKLLLLGTDDPAQLQITGRHAFIVLGYQLRDGEMTQELCQRCDAAAAAARAFPEAVLICTGGATGGNNPERHTEAGRMRDYLTARHGIAPERIYIDEQAMTTEENAVNTFRILQDLGIESITLVTSDYHLRWAETLYNALAAISRQTSGYSVTIIGNFCCPIRSATGSTRTNARTAIRQLSYMLRRTLPR
ncbi:MAG: YdcF family protein [Clostridia bacterium]|nr:YdcF family protein [Clostridia bacterium]